MGDWGNITPDLLILIASRIDLILDFVAFRGVCKLWRHVFTKELFFKKSHEQPPLMMLAKKHNEKIFHYLYCLVNEKTHPISLPESHLKRCFPTLGWLVTENLKTRDVELFHLLSRVQLQLPCQFINSFDKYYVIYKAVLSANPSYTQNYMLVVITGSRLLPLYRRLAFWKPTSQTWNHLSTPTVYFKDLIFHNNKFHAIDNCGWVYVLDFPLDGPPRVDKICIMDQLSNIKYIQIYLVESKGSLLIVSKVFSAKFDVYEFDTSRGVIEKIQDLGYRALFVGLSASSSVDTRKFPAIKPNCIYHTDDTEWSLTNNIGVYNLTSSEKTENYDKGQSTQSNFPPLWFIPSL